MVHLMAAFHFFLCGYKRGSYTEMYLRFSFSKVRHLKNKLLGMSALLIYLFFLKSLNTGFICNTHSCIFKQVLQLGEGSKNLRTNIKTKTSPFAANTSPSRYPQ